jgi:hypothetical protein
MFNFQNQFILERGKLQLLFFYITAMMMVMVIIIIMVYLAMLSLAQIL